MRIAIDGSAIPAQMAGAGVYTCSLVRALATVDRDNEYVVFARKGLFDDLERDSPSFKVMRITPHSRLTRLLWEQVVLAPWLRRLGVSLLHSPHHTTPLVAPGRRRVVTFHDLTFFILPERYPRARRLYFQTMSRAAARVADALVCPSHTVKQDIVRILRVPEQRVHPIAEAAAPAFQPLSDTAPVQQVRAKYGLTQPFILNVGSLEPGKNRTALLKAYARLREHGLEHRLVVVGQKAWGYEGDFRLVEELQLAESVVFTGYVQPADMPALYNAADLFVFPSLYEGFGLPVVEAMACGVPVVSSNVSSMPEVAGEAAALVDPRDSDQLGEAMEQVIRDRRLHDALSRRGLERAKLFSWEKAARETIAVYEEAMRR